MIDTFVPAARALAAPADGFPKGRGRPAGTVRGAAVAVAGFAALTVCAGAAQARAFDAKDLARYDLSYAQCEQKYDAMRGHRDEAYLNLYRVKPDNASLARLESIRKGSAYLAERKRAQAAAPAPGASAPLSPKLAQQCQGLWSESKKVEALRR